MQTISINNLKNIEDIDYKDKILIFRKIDEDSFEPFYLSFDELCDYLIDIQSIPEIENHLNSISKTFEKLLKVLSTKFLTRENSKNIFATKDEVANYFKTIQTLKEFKDKIRDKLTKAKLEALGEDSKARIKQVKRLVMTGSGKFEEYVFPWGGKGLPVKNLLLNRQEEAK